MYRCLSYSAQRLINRCLKCLVENSPSQTRSSYLEHIKRLQLRKILNFSRKLLARRGTQEKSKPLLGTSIDNAVISKLMG